MCDSSTVLILYGSQTGNAEEIARSLHSDAERCSIPSSIASMKAFIDSADISALANYKYVVLVCSTTGNGEAPDNAQKFWRKLRLKKDIDWLKEVNYSVLGLGDTNYDQFCAMGKNLDRTMKKYAANCFVPSGFADEAVGLDSTVEPWKKSVIEFLVHVFSTDDRNCQVEEKETISSLCRNVEPREVENVPRYRKPTFRAEFLKNESRNRRTSGDELYSSRWKITDTEAVLRGYTPDTPFLSEIKAAKYLTSESSEKQVIHVELDLPFANRGITYCVGDSIGVYCPNEWDTVEKLLARLNVDGNLQIKLDDASKKSLPHIHTPCTIRDAFLYCLDLNALPQKALLRILAEYCLDESDRQILYNLSGRSKENRAAYDEHIVAQKPSLLDLLQRFPSCYPDISHMLEQLPALSPRYYSVSSSPAVYPTSLHVALTVVRYNVQDSPLERRGLCSSWLHDLCIQQKLLPHRACLGPIPSKIEGAACRESNRFAIPVFIRKGKEFTLPSDSSKPIIMIGPGTGVAPFRAFAQHRRVQTKALQTGGTCVGWWRGFEVEIEAKEPEDENVEEEIPKWGKAVLYFGCRKKSWDYLYGEEFEELELDRALDSFRVAFSREEEGTKTYVQDLIRENAEEVYKMIVQEQGYVFVCGDVSAMTKDVQQAFAQVLEQQQNISSRESIAAVHTMIKEGRYIQDIWN